MPEKLCKICKKIPTNHPSGTCVMCMIYGGLPPQKQPPYIPFVKEELKGKTNVKIIKKEGGRMAAPKNKQCKNEGCFKFAVKDGMCTRCYNEAHGIKKHLGRKPKKSQASLQSPQKVIECKSVSRGKAAEPESKKCHSKLDSIIHRQVQMGQSIGNSNYIISVDLSFFPKIYKFITALPELSADDMLYILLKQRLNELEERIAI